MWLLQLCHNNNNCNSIFINFTIVASFIYICRALHLILYCAECTNRTWVHRSLQYITDSLLFLCANWLAMDRLFSSIALIIIIILFSWARHCVSMTPPSLLTENLNDTRIRWIPPDNTAEGSPFNILTVRLIELRWKPFSSAQTVGALREQPFFVSCYER